MFKFENLFHLKYVQIWKSMQIRNLLKFVRFLILFHLKYVQFKIYSKSKKKTGRILLGRPALKNSYTRGMRWLLTDTWGVK
jgi:hypothetical protein